MDAGTREVYSRSDVHKKASIELHRLTLASMTCARQGRDVSVLLARGELERYTG